jgi:hypothetical protein
LRPGEKLFEELCYQGENVAPTAHPKIRRLVCEAVPIKRVRDILNDLIWQSDLLEPDQLKQLLKWAVPEYQPQLTTDESPQPLKEKPNFEPKLKTLSDEVEILTAGLSVPSPEFSG